MQKLLGVLLLLGLFPLNNLFAQELFQDQVPEFQKTPTFVMKSNLLYDATTTINIGAEFKVGRKSTLDLPVNINPWTFSDNKKLKHWMFQPEWRYWVCEPFSGSFWGIHAHGGQFNIGGIKLPFGLFPELEDHRYEGWFVGGGISYGYHWVLSNRWSLEGTIGVGYVYIDYDKYECQTCGKHQKSDNKDYWGITKVGLSLIYIIK